MMLWIITFQLGVISLQLVAIMIFMASKWGRRQ